MVWGSFSSNGTDTLRQIKGIMDTVVYGDFLEIYMLPQREAKMPSGWNFQEDNDPKHTSRLVKDWFKPKGIRVLE